MQKAWAFMVQSEDFAHCYVEEMRTRDWIRSEQVSDIWVLSHSPPTLIGFIPLIAGTVREQAEYQLCQRTFIHSRRAPTCKRNHTLMFSSVQLTKIAVPTQDPYFPPMKHGLAWHLKRSRSVGCLRELSPIPVLDEDDGLLQLNRIEEMDED